KRSLFSKKKCTKKIYLSLNKRHLEKRPLSQPFKIAGFRNLALQGVMREVLSAAIDYLFREHDLHRIMACYMPANQRSGALLERLGFEREGFARAYLMINGRWEDHILTSLINPAP
ncbi:GNAT family N-acetyltransferase, partial [Aeromonas veronii]|uniref:GNAT family N-acetyltransferase n=1 Tax=Aeromonas veronii TaxID=654 RepID=UPI001F25600D